MSKERIIFVDFFDTIMFRKVHPYAIFNRWAFLLSRWLGNELLKDDILYYRRIAESQISKNGYERHWRLIYENIYNQLSQSLIKEYDKDAFVNICHRFEIDLEIGAQYPHKSLLMRLKKLNEKGYSIYIVSDFHLDREDLIAFMQAKNIDLSLFDDIFVSSDLGCSKNKGNIYAYLVNKLCINPSDVLMIGDNSYSDGRMARKNGINAKVEHNYAQKLIYQFRRLIKYDYSKRAFCSIEKTSRKFNSPYSEYALIFYLFSKKLRNHLVSKHARYVTFLSREGYYLKKSFDNIQTIYRDVNLTSNYLFCSRRSCQSLNKGSLDALQKEIISIYDYLMACGYDDNGISVIANEYSLTKEELLSSNDELINNIGFIRLKSQKSFISKINEKIDQSQKAFEKYIDSIDKDQEMNIVDIGWKGSMQEMIDTLLSSQTEGLYLGLNDSLYSIQNKKGLIFTHCPAKCQTSLFSEIFRVNIQLYEQLTAAPHGSAVGYVFDSENNVSVLTDWSENERLLYNNFIESKQEEMLLIERGVAVWCGEKSDIAELKSCAKLVLHSALFANKERIEFLRNLDKGYIWNFNSQVKGITYNKKSVRLALDIIYAPERYARYMAKIQRTLQMPISQFFYKIFMPIIYMYIWGVSCLKNRNK